jgi:integrase
VGEGSLGLPLATLLSKNVNLKEVSEMLGHANVTVTLDTYSHVLPHMQDRGVDAMDSSLS